MKHSLRITLLLSPLLFCLACVAPKQEVIEKPPPQKLINPPFNHVNIPFDTFKINPAKSQVIKLPTGSHLSFNSNILVDEFDCLVSDSVSFIVREIHDGISAYLTGIPLTIGLNTEKKSFQSAGMIEIHAFNGNQPVYLTEGDSIRVTIITHNADTGFNQYYLSDSLNDWVDIKDNVAIENERRREIIRTIQNNKLVRQAPLKPGHFVMEYESLLDMDQLFLKRNPDKNEVLAKARKYGLTPMNFVSYDKITFKGLEVPAWLMVWDKIDGTPFPIADSIVHTAKLTHQHGAIYELNLSKNKKTVYQTRIRAVMSLKSLYSFSPDYWRNNYRTAMNRITEERKRLVSETHFVRKFQINAFGPHNIDRIKNLSNAPVAVAFNFPEPFDAKVFNPKIFLVNKRENFCFDVKFNADGTANLGKLEGNFLITQLNQYYAGVIAPHKYDQLVFNNSTLKQTLTFSKVEATLIPEMINNNSWNRSEEALTFR